MRKGALIPIGIIIISSLVSCANVAMTGAQVVYNRRSIKNNLSDHYITMQAYQSLYMQTDTFADTNIAIATYNGDVLLAGQAPTLAKRLAAGEIVKKVEGIKQLYNLIEIQNPSSTITRMSDAWLTTKVKAQLIASEDVDATRIKVVTENGTVYLMGILPVSEAEEAVAIASSTDGVRRVVKIFSYLKITKDAVAEDNKPTAS